MVEFRLHPPRRPDRGMRCIRFESPGRTKWNANQDAASLSPSTTGVGRPCGGPDEFASRRYAIDYHGHRIRSPVVDAAARALFGDVHVCVFAADRRRSFSYFCIALAVAASRRDGRCSSAGRQSVGPNGGGIGGLFRCSVGLSRSAGRQAAPSGTTHGVLFVDFRRRIGGRGGERPGRAVRFSLRRRIPARSACRRSIVRGSQAVRPLYIVFAFSARG
jgi:hypothetical protein